MALAHGCRLKVLSDEKESLQVENQKYRAAVKKCKQHIRARNQNIPPAHFISSL